MNRLLTTRRALARAVLLALLLIMGLPAPAQSARIKDIAQVDGFRDNQLVGYGLVVGLDGTGDTRRVRFTQQSIAAMLSRMGVRVDPTTLELRNVAAVMVTAALPALAGPGTPIDVVVSAVGDARSLAGGTLLLTPLSGTDGVTYAMAQGPVNTGGYGARGRAGSRFSKNHLNVGRIASGAYVERTVPMTVALNDVVTLLIKKPDYTTATRTAAAINTMLGDGVAAARAETAGRVLVTVPLADRENLASFVARLEVLEVTPDTAARVVVNGRTGTVVLGAEVRISPVAVAHGGLQVEIGEIPRVSQPAPASRGETRVVSDSRIAASEASGKLRVVEQGSSLGDLVRALNSLGAKPRDLVAILEAVQASGALHASLEVL